MRIHILLLGVVMSLAVSAALANGAGVMQPAPTAQPTPEVAVPATPGAGPTQQQVSTGQVMEPVSPEVDMFNQTFLSTYYGLSNQSIMDLRAQGYSWGEINFMSNLAARTQRPISEIAIHHTQGLTWVQIGGRYNIATADLTRPYIPVARVAGFVGEVGVAPPAYYMMDRFGNPILTANEAELYRVRGYDWQTVAIAANVSARTGVPIREILRMTDTGATWQQIAQQYGLRMDDILDVSAYPFSRDPTRGVGYDQRVAQQQQQMVEWYGVRPAPIGAGVGAGPIAPVPPETMQPVSPAPHTVAPNY